MLQRLFAQYLKPLAQNEYVISDTLKFPKLLEQIPIADDEEDVSYDVESLFTNVPINDTIEHILKEIYEKESIQPICSRLIFKRLLHKLTSGCIFSANENLYKQIDGCAMGDPLSVTLAGIHMNKMEKEVVAPTKPKLYKRYIDDVYHRRKKDVEDELFQAMNNHHPNIQLTIEVNPKVFLDTALEINGSSYEKSLHRKDTKLPTHWTSKVPKRYKRNAIMTELHRAKSISDNFQNELNKTRTKYKGAGFPPRFVESVITQFGIEKEEKIIPDYLFEERGFLPVNIPFCDKNEIISKRFLEKLNEFTHNRYRTVVMWKTRKVKSLFPLKDKNVHQSCVIYEGECSCGIKYVGETKRNATVRWSEHNKPSNISEPAIHLTKNIAHQFNWKVLCKAPGTYRLRRILEAYYIAIKKPGLNEQLESHKLNLFRNGVT